MSYFEFHLLFNLPLLAFLLFVARKRLCVAHWKWIGVLMLLVMALVTPWDNWAVHKGIWGFEWERTTPVSIPWRGVEWRLPAEEYAFFILETLAVGLLTILFLKPKGTGREV